MWLLLKEWGRVRELCSRLHTGNRLSSNCTMWRKHISTGVFGFGGFSKMITDRDINYCHLGHSTPVVLCSLHSDWYIWAFPFSPLWSISAECHGCAGHTVCELSSEQNYTLQSWTYRTIILQKRASEWGQYWSLTIIWYIQLSLVESQGFVFGFLFFL